jgi:hypothetical protein
MFLSSFVGAGRPDAPRDVQVTCSNSSSTITWLPGADNNDRIVEFVIYLRESSPTSQAASPTSANDTAGFDIADHVPVRAGAPAGRTMSHEVAVKPWRSYEFRVVARNGVGTSDTSSTLRGGSTKCVTPEARPYRNPSGVCTQLRATGQLVIVWQVSGHSLLPASLTPRGKR